MVKARIVAVVVVKGGVAVQSVGFRRYLPLGKPEIAIEFLNQWGIDEIVLLDIDATPEGRAPRHEQLPAFVQRCLVPLSVGGGVTGVEQMQRLIQSGADKVVINSAAVHDPSMITRGAYEFGTQAMIVSIDARRLDDGQYRVFTHSGTRVMNHSPAEFARIAQDMGAGECFVTSIDRDGSKRGFDLDLLDSVSEAVEIPVVICGGVGRAEHLLEGIRAGASGVAAANFFHFTEHSVTTAKQLLSRHVRNVRLDTHATYEGCNFDLTGRVTKYDTDYLRRLRLKYIPEEAI